MLSFLIIPAFFVFGYFVEVLNRTVGGVEEPPSFSDWGSLAVNGLVAAVITFVYYLIPLVVFLVLGGMGAVAGNNGGATLGILGMLISFVLFVALTYVYPAAITNYARSGSAGKAFAFGEIMEVITSGDYVVAWLLGFVIFVAGFVVVGVLSIIPLLGTLVGLFINFYISVAAYRVFGSAFREAAPDLAASA